MRELESEIKFILTSVALLMAIGLVMIFSASYISAKENFGSSYYFVFRQLAYGLIGIGAFFVVSKTRMSFWYKYSKYFLFITIGLLALTLIPYFGISIKGSNRWLNLGFMSIQPGEIQKLFLGIFSIIYFNQFEKMTRNDRIIGAGLLVSPLLINLMQPDFGTFLISMMILLFSCFVSGFPRKYFYYFIIFGVTSAAFLAIAKPYRVKRLLTFLDPWKDPKNSGFQIIQSYLAFANGGVFGQGIGNSSEKLFYLPEAHNDFILSVIGEELGFIGVLVIVCLFFFFFFICLRAALNSKSFAQTSVVSIMAFLITIQAAVNMGVVLGLLPTKGLNLPFISYGGTSLIINLICVGVIISALKSKEDFSFQGNIRD